MFISLNINRMAFTMEKNYVLYKVRTENVHIYTIWIHFGIAGVALNSLQKLQLCYERVEVCPDPRFITVTRPDPAPKFYIQLCYPYPIGDQLPFTLVGMEPDIFYSALPTVPLTHISSNTYM